MTLVKVPSTQVVSHSLRALVEQGLDMPAGWKCLPVGNACSNYCV